MHFSCNIKLPPLTEKDIAAVKHSIKKGVKIFAMSFVNSHKDVDKIRELIGKKSFLISKIETDNAIRNLKSISKNPMPY